METKTKNLESIINSLEFDYVNSDITEEIFPAQKVSKDLKVFNFYRHISSDDIEKEMAKEGYSPANIYELLEYAKKDWNGTDLVIALDSVATVHGNRYVACLVRRGAERGLYLYYRDYEWGGHCHFLARRNTESLEKSGSLSLETLNLRLSALESKMSKLEKIIRLD